jgi:hypothetical protein
MDAWVLRQKEAEDLGGMESLGILRGAFGRTFAEKDGRNKRHRLNRSCRVSL